MQRDMHFYATYVLARMSGMGVKIARRVADASEYVDEAVRRDPAIHPRGVRVLPEVTAHHLVSVENLDPDDQRKVWVVFHFFPGGAGRTTLERLVCRPMARPLGKLVEHYIQAMSGQEFFPELVGIAAHVIMDSFSHAGFSGVASPLNRVKQGSLEYQPICVRPGDKPVAERGLRTSVERFFGRFGQGITDVMDELKEEIAAVVGEAASNALGHAGAATLPDRGYVRWRCEYEVGERVLGRENPRVFWRACQELYGFFTKALGAAPWMGEGAQPLELDERAAVIKRLIRTCGEEQERCRAWREAIKAGILHPLAGDERAPVHSFRKLEKPLDSLPDMPDPREIRRRFIYRFYQAASYHRHYALRRLLPSWGIVVA